MLIMPDGGEAQEIETQGAGVQTFLCGRAALYSGRLPTASSHAATPNGSL